MVAQRLLRPACGVHVCGPTIPVRTLNFHQSLRAWLMSDGDDII